jgi:hypothetical protein
MSDPFGSTSPDLESPAAHAFLITPGSSPLAVYPRGLYIGGAGNINVTMVGGETLVFTGLPAGALLPIRVSHVLATNTTATAIIGLY